MSETETPAAPEIDPRDQAAKLLSVIFQVPTGNAGQRIAELNDEELAGITTAARETPRDLAAIRAAIKQAETSAYDRRRVTAEASTQEAIDAAQARKKAAADAQREKLLAEATSAGTAPPAADSPEDPTDVDEPEAPAA